MATQTGYLGNERLKKVGTQFEFSQEQILEYARCQEDIIYFIETYCKIITLDHGLQPFIMFDFQKEFVKTLDGNRFVMGMMPRQQSKTTCVAAYILHYVLFNDGVTVAILANKAPAAREVMSRIQLMYEELPSWLQLGVAEWNKGNVTLENNSKIFTSATSASAVRGKSCLTGTSKVCVKDNNNVFYLEIDKLKEKLDQKTTVENCSVKYKTVNKYTGKVYIGSYDCEKSNIKETKTKGSCFFDGYLGSGETIIEDIVKYGAESFIQEIIEVINIEEVVTSKTDNLTILSSDGFKKFNGILDQGISTSLYKITLSNGNTLKATGDHRFLMKNGEWETVDTLDAGDTFSTDLFVLDIEKCKNEQVYDIFEVEDVHNYYNDGIISHNCNLVYIDECAIIPSTLWDEFYASTYPTISSGTKSKIIMTSTPMGYNHWWSMWTAAKKGKNGFVTFESKWADHPKRDQAWADEQLSKLGEVKFQAEVCCSFVGSSFTLIDGQCIAKMSPREDKIYSKDGLDLYDDAEEKHTYVIVADTAKGVGGDYSAFTIFDITTVPYQIVGKYRNNEVSPLLYPNIIHKIAKKYNNAFVLVETNSSEQVPYILYHELEYENILMVARSSSTTAVTSQVVSGGFAGATIKLGVNTDKKVKRIGCQNLKSLIETNKLIIEDIDTISELSTFVEKHGSYAADEGYHDDLVMTLVLFAWLTTNDHFKELTNINLREMMYGRQMRAIEDSMTPFGFFDNGIPEEEVLLNF